MMKIDETCLYEGYELDGKALELFYDIEDEQEEAIIDKIRKKSTPLGIVTYDSMIYVYQIDNGCIYIENIVEDALFGGVEFVEE